MLVSEGQTQIERKEEREEEERKREEKKEKRRGVYVTVSISSLPPSLSLPHYPRH